MVRTVRAFLALLLALVIPMTMAAPPAHAILGHHSTPTTHRSFLHKHKLLTSAAAGIAAYHMAKHSPRNGRGNIMQRHPILTGMGAAMATHHILKKTDTH